jgi:hypothetical protein
MTIGFAARHQASMPSKFAAGQRSSLTHGFGQQSRSYEAMTEVPTTGVTV